MTTTNRKLPAGTPNPDPEYYNCICTQCGMLLHRQPSAMKPNRKYFCDMVCSTAWRREHLEQMARDQDKAPRVNGGRGVQLKWKGVVYG